MVAYYKECALFIYIVCCIIGYILVGIDKHYARINHWRISERTLLIFAVFGGVGVWIGMYMFHHKTNKPKFYLGVPCLIIIFILLMLV